MNRAHTRQVVVGNKVIGGNNNIVIQSMTDTKTSDVKATVKQIKLLEKYGVELIRVAVLDENDAISIQNIKKLVKTPIIADIHFDSKLAILAIEYGADKIRINPGNFPIKDLNNIIEKAKEYDVPIRIGVNYASIDKKYAKLEPAQAMLESIKEYVKLFEDKKFYNLVLSVKSSNIDDFIEANELIADQFSYPIHIGLTEAGSVLPGSIKSTYALTNLIDKGIGSTIRVSLNGNKENEVIAAKEILKITNIKDSIPTLIACPNCGRACQKTTKIVKNVEKMLNLVDSNIKVAVMGCVVNGPGEASNADIGVALGNGYASLFKKGKIVKKIEIDDIEKVLKEEINKMVD